MASILFSTRAFTTKMLYDTKANLYGYDKDRNQIDPITVRHYKDAIFFTEGNTTYVAKNNGKCCIIQDGSTKIFFVPASEIFIPFKEKIYLSAAKLTAILNKIKAANLIGQN